MSQGNSSNKSHNDALAALQGLGGEDAPAKKSKDEPIEVEGESDGTELSGASGFVGMLAKNGPPSEEPVPTRPTAPGSSSRPTPKPQGGDSVAGKSPRMARSDEIKMAKEITMPVSAPAASSPSRSVPRSAPGRGPRRVPGWYHMAVPVMYTISSLLIFISFWAIGAVIYIWGVNPNPQSAEDVKYPLLMWSENAFYNNAAGYYEGGISGGSKAMAVIMLAALPVAITLVVMGIVMQKQVRRFEAAAKNQ